MKNTLTILLPLLTLISCLQEDPEAIPPPETTEGDWLYFNSLDGLSSGFVFDVFLDDEGYWIATSEGVSFYDFEEEEFYYVPEEVLVDNYVTSIAEDDNGALWFGTFGGASVIQNGEWFLLDSIGGSPWQIQDMEQQENGDLLIGTTFLGVIIYDGSQFYQYFDNSCNNCNIINTIYEDSEENIWIGSNADLKQFNSDFVLGKQYDSELAGIAVQAIHEDFLGRIWVGFRDGHEVNILSNDGIDELTVIGSYPDVPVYGFIDGPGNELWIGTLVNNLLYYDGGVVRTLFDGPDTDHNIVMLKRIENQIFVGTEDGAYVYTIP